MDKVTQPEVNRERELKTVQQFAVDLTVDPDTAYVKLSVSKDLKQVHHTDQKNYTDSPQRFTYFLNVFTKQSFFSGRFYFEVEVKGKTQWVLGVAKESVDKEDIDILNNKYGYWCLFLDKEKAFVSYDEPRVPLSLKSRPQKVGVFVDYDEGLVSFYDVDTADLIYSFTDCCFREKLFPFLNPCANDFGKNSTPLILTAVKK